jgi:hypothetical protein
MENTGVKSFEIAELIQFPGGKRGWRPIELKAPLPGNTYVASAQTKYSNSLGMTVNRK